MSVTARPFLPLTGEEPTVVTERQVEAVRRHLLERLDLSRYSPFGPEAVTARSALKGAIRQALEAGVVPDISRRQITEALVEAFYAAIFGLGPLEGLLNRSDVLEITVTAPDAIVVRDADIGDLRCWEEGFTDRDHLQRTLQNLALRLGHTLSPQTPILDLRIPDPPLRVQINLFGVPGPTFALRRGRVRPFTLEDLVENGTLDRQTVDFFDRVLAVPVGFVVTGVPGTGKTTLLEALVGRLTEILPSEVIGVVEDTVELTALAGRPTVLHTALGALPEGRARLEDLTTAQLRSNARVLVVGEIRRQEEAGAALLVAPGMRATCTTLHGSTPENALARLLMLARGPRSELAGARREDVAAEIARTFPLVIQTDQLPDGRYILRQVAWLWADDAGRFHLTPVCQAQIDHDGEHFVVRWTWRDEEAPAGVAERLRLHEAHRRRIIMIGRVQSRLERARLLARTGRWNDAAALLRTVLEDEPGLFEELAPLLEQAMRAAGLWPKTAEEAAQMAETLERLLEDGYWEEAQAWLETLRRTPFQRAVLAGRWTGWQRRLEEVRRQVQVVEAVCRRAEALAQNGAREAALDLLERTDVSGLPRRAMRQWQEMREALEQEE